MATPPRVHPPSMLSPFQRVPGAAHPDLLPAGTACNAADEANGELLGRRDAQRARAGQRVTVQAFVQSAGICYKKGYLRGLAQPGITLTGRSKDGALIIYTMMLGPTGGSWNPALDYTGAVVGVTIYPGLSGSVPSSPFRPGMKVAPGRGRLF